MMYRSYYASQDVGADTWTVYAEVYGDPDGEPVDRSQRAVTTVSGEQVAERLANDLFALCGGW